MDDRVDTPTEKINRSDRRPEGPQIYQRDTPTEKLDRGRRRQPEPGPQVEQASPAAKTEILDREPPTFAWLVVVTGPQKGEIRRLSADVTTIGRDGSNKIQLDDEFVSRQHAKVRAEEDEDGNTHFYIYDPASSGGVFVNGERVYRHQLVDGDQLELGQTKLVFKRPAKLLMEDGNDD